MSFFCSYLPSLRLACCIILGGDSGTVLTARELHTPKSPYEFRVCYILLVLVRCKGPLFGGRSRHAPMLHVNKQFIGHAVHALALSLVCQFWLHVIVCPGRLQKVFSSHHLTFESVAAIISRGFALHALLQLADLTQIHRLHQLVGALSANTTRA